MIDRLFPLSRQWYPVAPESPAQCARPGAAGSPVLFWFTGTEGLTQVTLSVVLGDRSQDWKRDQGATMPKQPDTPFGHLMREGLRRTGISQGKLGGRISDFEHGPVYDASAIRMLMSGQRRLTHKIVAQIIDILGLDWAEAWAASGLLPPDVSAAELELIQARRRRRADREIDDLAPPAASLGGLQAQSGDCAEGSRAA